VAGRPKTTGSKAVRPIQFRISDDERAEIEAEAAEVGISVDLLAKQRTFGRATIYALIDPRTDLVRYVGQTRDVAGRFSQHLHGDETDGRRDWVLELRTLRLTPKITPLETCDYADVLEREAHWIRVYVAKSADLLNRRKPTGRMDGRRLVIRMSPEERAEWAAAAARAGLTETEAVRVAMAAWLRSKPAAQVGASRAAGGELRIEREVDPTTGAPA
jgi:hypothetical protein